jgi:hypothetical protein
MEPEKKRGAGTTRNPINDLNLKDCDKGNTKHLQFKQTFAEYFKEPQTMKMVSVKTGIDRANICRYNRVMRKGELIKIVKVGICPVTKHRANYYTTNPQLFPIDLQGKLF